MDDSTLRWQSGPDARHPVRNDRRKVDDGTNTCCGLRYRKLSLRGSYPRLETGGWENAADAIRRATLDPDPTSTMKTIAGQFARLDEQVRRLTEAPRMAASGPVACGSAEAPKPLP